MFVKKINQLLPYKQIQIMYYSIYCMEEVSLLISYVVPYNHL